MTFNLNRVSFFDNQTNFPREVLRALVYTCGVSVTNQQIISREREIINFVKNFKREVNVEFDKIEDNNGLIKIADYIGSQNGWKNKDNLIKSLKNIITFNDSLDIETLIEKNDGLKLSFKNNDNIYNCDILMAYKYCLVKKIEIEKDDTSEIISQKILDYLSKDRKNREIEEELKRISGEREIEDKFREEKLKEEMEKEEKLKEEIRKEELEREEKLRKEELKERLNLESEIKIRELKDKIMKDEELKERLNLEFRELKDKISKDEEIKERLNLELRELKENNNKQIKEIEKDVENLKIKHTLELKELKNLDKKEGLNLDSTKTSHQKISDFLNAEPKNKYELEDIEKFLKISLRNLLISKTLLTNEEAIFIGLRVFFFDLRNSPLPFEDLLNLNECRKDDKIFIPDRDDIFSKNLKLNKNYYYIDHYYKKDLKSFYTQNILNLLFEEYSIEDRSMNKLEDYYENDNFHRGWLGGDKNYKSSNILSFGKPDIKIVSFEVQELIEYFKINGPKNILNNTELTPGQIEGLKSICNKFPKDEGFNNLLNSLERKNLEEDIEIKFILSKYLFASETINKTFDDMFRIGMFIRGWRLSGTNSSMVYPLQKKDCVDFVDRNKEIIEKVDKVKGDLKYHIEKLNIAVKNSLKKLPLVNYIGGDFVYDKNGNKVNVMLEGLENLNDYNHKEVSNYLLLVSYYYTFLTSSKKLYSIESLELL